MPAAYFLVCLTMGEDTPENVKQAIGYAKPMIKIKEPVNLGLFGGCLKHDEADRRFRKSDEKRPGAGSPGLGEDPGLGW